MKKALCIMLCVIVSIIFPANITSAEDSIDLSVSVMEKNVKVGEELTVKVGISSQASLGKVSAVISYDNSLLAFQSGDSAIGSNGIITIDHSGGESTSAELSLRFTASSPGTAVINVVNCSATNTQGIQIEAESTYTSFEISPKEQSTSKEQEPAEQNAVPSQGVLVDLKTDKGTLIPPFMYSIHEYSITVPYEVDKVEIEGKTASKTDRIWYTGNPECVVGNNIRTITVTDVNNNETVYKISILRLDKAQEQTQAAAQTVAFSQISETTPEPKDSSAIKTDKKDSLKEKLMPALYIVLIALVVSLIIVVIWIHSRISRKNSEKEDKEEKSLKKRSRIKVTSSKKKGKNKKK